MLHDQEQNLIRRLYSPSQASVTMAMQEIVTILFKLKSTEPEPTWRDLSARWGTSELAKVIRHDPFTRWAYEKPSGYPGDARLLDYIYGSGHAEKSNESPDSIASRIHAYTIMAPSCRAVRWRRDWIRERIGEFLHQYDSPRILSLACGHLRELHGIPRSVLSASKFVAIDQDMNALKEVQSHFGEGLVDTRCQSLKELFVGKAILEKFDLIYTLGLFDYLEEQVAAELTRILFEALNPGGELIVANFTPETPDKGYMDAIMAWPLIFRTADDMQALTNTLPRDEIDTCSTFKDPHGVVVYQRIKRKL